MIDETIAINRLKLYERKLSNHLHNCSGIEALKRHQSLISRGGIDRFKLIWNIKGRKNEIL